jgi:hypothetical protein
VLNIRWALAVNLGMVSSAIIQSIKLGFAIGNDCADGIQLMCGRGIYPIQPVDKVVLILGGGSDKLVDG